MKGIHALVLVFIFGIALLALGYLAATSIYVVEGYVSSQAATRVVARDNITTAWPPAGSLFGPAEPYLPQVAIAGWSKDAGATELVLLPLLDQQLVLAQELRAHGWQVQRLGLVLWAGKSTDQKTQLVPPRWWEGYGALATAWVKPSWPMHPAFIIQADAGSVPLLTQPVFVVGELHEDAVRLHIAPSRQQLHPRTLHAGVTTANEDITISVPGKALAALPAPLQEFWNGKLGEALAFAHTKPDFVSALASFEVVQLSLTPSGAAISAESETESFSARATAWVQEEERATRLEKSPFRLPDGTLAYELVPGEPGEVFAPVQGNGCSATLPGAPPLVLCGTTLATSEAAAAQIAAAATTYIAIGSQPLAEAKEKFCTTDAPWWCAIKALQFTQAGKQALIEVEL